MRSQFPVPGTAAASGQGPSGSNERSPLEKNPLQPASLRRHHLYATPVSRRSLMLAGRGKQALQEGQAWQSKVSSPCTVSQTSCLCTSHITPSSVDQDKPASKLAVVMQYCGSCQACKDDRLSSSQVGLLQQHTTRIRAVYNRTLRVACAYVCCCHSSVIHQGLSIAYPATHARCSQP